MSKFDVRLTIEATSIGDALNSILYPFGDEVDGIVYISATEAAE